MVVEIVTPSAYLQTGQRFPVLESRLLATWDKAPGRPPTAEERSSAREPYVSPNTTRRAKREAPDDELLNERAALQACRREQQREPADLIGRAHSVP
jgi:hypothetical protein